MKQLVDGIKQTKPLNAEWFIGNQGFNVVADDPPDVLQCCAWRQLH
jgi:hypothetical protein